MGGRISLCVSCNHSYHMATPLSPERMRRRPADFFKLNVKSPNNDLTEFEVTVGETVGELKRRIEATIGVFVKDQRLLHNATLMVDERTLGSYRLSPNSTISLV